MRRALVVLLVAGVACSGPTVHVVTPRYNADTARGERAPVSGTSILADTASAGFDRNDLVGPIQAASRSLVRVVPHSNDLEVHALHSPTNEAAVEVRETDHGSQRWGRLMIPAERTIIGEFARDQSLGGWLVIVDDVRVPGGVDPVPLTGYRWTRAAVESYARCGIPTRAIDACTSQFYLRSQMWLMPVGSKPIGG
jgi:hypothetical protein